MEQKADLSGLTKAGRKFQTAPTVEKEPLKKPEEPVTENKPTSSDFSHLGGKLVARSEIPAGDVEPVDFSELDGRVVLPATAAHRTDA